MNNGLGRWLLVCFGWLVISCGQQTAPTEHRQPNCVVGELKAYSPAAILDSLHQERADSLLGDIFPDIIDSCIANLEGFQHETRQPWPGKPFTHIEYWHYAPWDGDPDHLDLVNRELKESFKLCADKHAALQDLLNNPLFFSFGECGTQIPEAELRFYQDQEYLGHVVLSCNHGQLGFYPENPLARFGSLSLAGNRQLDAIAPWR